MRANVGVLWLVAAMLLGGCSAAEPVASQSSSVVYGEDDRLDYYEVTSPALQERGRQSVVAVISPDNLDETDPEQIGILAVPLADAMQLCEPGRFGNQPSASTCSGTLIDNDIVLAAGHCFLDEEDCRRHRFVFDYYLSGPRQLEYISRDDVYACRALLANRSVLDGADFAVVKLDRPVAGDRAVAAVDTSGRSVTAGAALVAIGFGDGLPMKFDSGGQVLDPDPGSEDFFTATVDAFAGTSGMGIFSPELSLVGLLASGATDYIEVEDSDCWRVNVLDEQCADCELYGECITHAATAISALCARDWPSDPLCGTAPVCGDGVCSGQETSATCPGDCPEPRCGDGVCDPEDLDRGCTDDCGSPLDRPAPDEWHCSAIYAYAQRDGCDCECGAYDPDCNDPTQQVYRCPWGATCSPEGTCTGSQVPPEWTCDPLAYYAEDGCHCGCGVADPDCAMTAEPAIGCEPGEACHDGECVPAPEATSRPHDSGCWCTVGSSRSAGSWATLFGSSVLALARRRRAQRADRHRRQR